MILWATRIAERNVSIFCKICEATNKREKIKSAQAKQHYLSLITAHPTCDPRASPPSLDET